MRISEDPRQRKAQLTILAVVILAIAAAFILFLTSTLGSGEFRITRTSPSGTLPSSSNRISFTFSNDVAQQQDQPDNYLTLDPELPHDTEIAGNIVAITFKERPDENTQLSVMFNEITADDGAKMTDTIVFDVAYVPYADLPSEEKQSQSSNSGSANTDRHPMYDFLPYEKPSYRVSAVRVEDVSIDHGLTQAQLQHGFIIVVETFAIREGVSDDDYIATTKRIRERASIWVKETGANPNGEIPILYFPDDTELIEDEFTGDGVDPATLESLEFSTQLIDNGEGSWQ